MSHRLGTVVDFDSGAPFVQGAVGHVMALRGADGSSYVLKSYSAGGQRQAATEVLGLRLLGGIGAVPVPGVVARGDLPGRQPLSYVVMTRLAGVRWADRRGELNARQSLAMHSAVGLLLRRLHVLSRQRFGELLDEGRRWPTAWARVDARCDELVEAHLRAGGPAELGRRVRGLVDDRRGALSSCGTAMLCHNDFIDGNILVAQSGEPQVLGVVDLEQSSWDDPLADLAQTKFHAQQHDPAAAEVLAAAYGVHGEQEHHRVAVHEVLHALRERTWVANDRPTGWKQAIAALEEFLIART